MVNKKKIIEKYEENAGDGDVAPKDVMRHQCVMIFTS
jgi:hypothetical protein